MWLRGGMSLLDAPFRCSSRPSALKAVAVVVAEERSGASLFLLPLRWRLACLAWSLGVGVGSIRPVGQSIDRWLALGGWVTLLWLPSDWMRRPPAALVETPDGMDE